MRFALVKSGLVQNVIEADDAFISTISKSYDSVVNVDLITAGPGYTYDGNNFTPPAASNPVDPNAIIKTNVTTFNSSTYNLLQTDTVVSINRSSDTTIVLPPATIKQMFLLKPGASLTAINRVIFQRSSPKETINKLTSDLTLSSLNANWINAVSDGLGNWLIG